MDNAYSITSVSHNISGYTTFLAAPEKVKKRQEFFLLLEHYFPTDELLRRLIKEDAGRFFEFLIKSELTDETFRKNCTLVLCCEKNSVSPETVLAVEEDPYNFKKNIITYTSVELQNWDNMITSSLHFKNLNELINEDMGNKFRQFKERGDSSNDYYSLLMKIVTKIPIIQYIPAEKDLYDLEAEIRKKLSHDDQEILDFIVNIDLTKSDDEIEKILLSDWMVRHE